MTLLTSSFKIVPGSCETGPGVASLQPEKAQDWDEKE